MDVRNTFYTMVNYCHHYCIIDNEIMYLLLPLLDHHFYQIQLFGCLHTYYRTDAESVDSALLWTLLGN